MVLEVLRSSLEMLSNRPKLFAPRLFTTLLYSYPIYLLSTQFPELFMGLEFALEKQAELLQAAMKFLLVSLGVVFVDLFVYAMYPGLVEDWVSRRDLSLTRALRKALCNFFAVVSFLLVLLAAAFIVALPSTPLFALYLLHGNKLFLWLGLGVLILASLLVAIPLPFGIPGAVVRNKLGGMLEGFEKGLRHKAKVFKLNLFALLLFCFSLAVANLLEAALGPWGFIAFVAVRLPIYTLVFAYLSVVYPYLYLRLG